MRWRAIELRFATTFSYRVPELAKWGSPVPGPSAIRLALVGAAREQAKQHGQPESAVAQPVFEAVAGCPLVVAPPERVTLCSATVRRLAPQRKPRRAGIDIRSDALPREYALASGPFWVWMELDDLAWQRLRSVLPWLRALGTRDSLCTAGPAEDGLPDWTRVAGEVRDEAIHTAWGQGSVVELRDLERDVTFETVMQGAHRLRPCAWGLPGDVEPLDETVRIFRLRPWRDAGQVLACLAARP